MQDRYGRYKEYKDKNSSISMAQIKVCSATKPASFLAWSKARVQIVAATRMSEIFDAWNHATRMSPFFKEKIMMLVGG